MAEVIDYSDSRIAFLKKTMQTSIQSPKSCGEWSVQYHYLAKKCLFKWPVFFKFFLCMSREIQWVWKIRIYLLYRERCAKRWMGRPQLDAVFLHSGNSPFQIVSELLTANRSSEQICMCERQETEFVSRSPQTMSSYIPYFNRLHSVQQLCAILTHFIYRLCCHFDDSLRVALMCSDGAARALPNLSWSVRKFNNPGLLMPKLFVLPPLKMCRKQHTKGFHFSWEQFE